MDSFGRRLTEIRKEMGLNQQQLAAGAQLSQGTVSAYENGNNPPRLDNLIRLAEYLHVTTDYLLGLSASPAPSKPHQQEDQLMVRLSRVRMPDVSKAPSAESIHALVQAIIAYIAAGSPAGNSPIAATGAVISAATNLLDAAAANSMAELIDAANALAAAGLQANDVVKEYIVINDNK